MFVGGILLPTATNDINSPLEAIGVVMVCSVMPIQFMAGMYGACVAMFQFESVMGVKRVWLLIATLLPVLIGLAGFVFVFLR